MERPHCSQAPKGEMSTETTTGDHFKQLSSSAPPRPIIPRTGTTHTHTHTRPLYEFTESVIQRNSHD